MLGNLSLDMFVMRKKKSAYIIALLIFGTAILFSIAAKVSTDLPDGTTGTFMDIFDASVHLTFLLLGIFYVLFLGSDIKDGFIKNIAGSVKSRIGYIFSKQTVLAVYTVIGTAVAAAGSFIFSTLFLDGAKDFELLFFCKYLGTVFVLFMGLAALLSFAVFFFRSTTVSMVISIIISGYVFNNLVYSLIDMMLDKLNVDFNIAYISLSKTMMNLGTKASDKDLLTACAVGSGYIIVFTILSKIALAKKDIA